MLRSRLHQAGAEVISSRCLAEVCRILKIRHFPNPFYGPRDGFGWSFGDNTGTLAPTGTYVVTAGAM